MIADEYGPVRMIRTKEWKYIHRYPFGPHEFYDLQADPGEKENLIGSPAHQERILSLRREMEEYFLRYGDPALDGAKEGANGSGQFCRPGKFASLPKVYGDIPLTDRQRETLLAHYFENKPICQIARERGVNRATVWRCLRRAEDRMRRYLMY